MLRLVSDARLYPGTCAAYPHLGADAGPFFDTGRTTPAGEHVYVSAVFVTEAAGMLGLVRADSRLAAREAVIDRLEARIADLEGQIAANTGVVDAARLLAEVA